MGEKLFSSFGVVFELSRGLRASQEREPKRDRKVCVEDEAIAISVDNVWCSFFCVLALASVIKRPIRLYYPDLGLLKYKKLFNQMILPRGVCDLNSNVPVFILWSACSGRVHDSQIVKFDHFVPLILTEKNPEIHKRKHAPTESSKLCAKQKKVQKKNSIIFCPQKVFV